MRSHDNQINVTLARWKLILSCLSIVLTLTAAVVGSYWKLQLKMVEQSAAIERAIGERNDALNDRISAVELTAQKSFAEKSDLKIMHEKIDEISTHVTRIETMIKNRR